ncbi:MAG: peptidase MA family metallohydrolase [Vicingaceae bacterium]|jgi:hypothetical protein|nr:peptidase MA family metallohydrolase [Vicingaceae bacterium]|tara:strand:+ start:16628 stop:17737 length:1110 start_codon:yes stop_codon:yes gene_type:complete
MKYYLFVLYFLSIQFCFGQSELSNPESDCKFILPWVCNECSFTWTGECLDNLPSGEGLLSVFHENQEEPIMTYEGEMEKGRFNGQGVYHDGMNNWEGTFENGNFIDTRIAMIDTTTFNEMEGWEQESIVTKQIDNIYFTFPAEGYAYNHRDAYVQKCLNAIDANSKLIKVPVFKQFTKIKVVDSKKDMLLYAGMPAGGGIANIWTRSVFFMISDEGVEETTELIKAPIKHEIMHMVAMTAWGMPPQNNTWLNEGLATYAANNCSGYTVAEIYRYFLEKNMLIPIEALTSNFYQEEEMVSYHQCAFIVEYMISNFGIEKFEELWKSGFSSFESIYGFAYSQMEIDLNKSIMETYPIPIDIDWETLKDGCK